ncbi:hypothetical protein LX32DRAFT_640485 [Colletotrichum zoysiae]|uniref:Uncharacterized protein n=1 Tax=Colletotrichum zoysiae TaxID=1216348 RepID=A0AAD9M0W8_9PEZI|nr:hypothetical protein LX32DRAFT_640485 [Colletotrichum zoysiae]
MATSTAFQICLLGNWVLQSRADTGLPRLWGQPTTSPLHTVQVFQACPPGFLLLGSHTHRDPAGTTSDYRLESGARYRLLTAWAVLPKDCSLRWLL